MARDPRAFAVKPCPPSYLAKGNAEVSAQTNLRRDFFNSIGKVGDVEIFNDIGTDGSKISQGLRTLASISNSIRTGCGSLPTIIGTSIDTGANWVLEQTGLAPGIVNVVEEFNPAIANQAYGQARQIYQMVEQGNFDFNQIPFYLQDFQNLERLSRNIYIPGRELKGLKEVCEASPYAVDLIARAPKYKFLFVVQFIFNSGYTTLDQLEFAFVVQRSTRPNIRFNLEDVNYYNYRTKVITRTEFEDMQMTFYDDTTNQSMRFYEAYLKAISPIANIESVAGMSTAEDDGMRFEEVLQNRDPETNIDFTIPSNRYTASVGPLNEDNKTVLREIKLFHVFDYGRQVNIFSFYNPRITQLQLDDVDMSVGSQGNEITFGFAYDTVYVQTNVPFQEIVPEELTRGGIYPLRYVDAASAARGPDQGGLPPTSPVQPQTCDSPTQQQTSNPPPLPDYTNVTDVSDLISGGGFGGGII